MQNLNRRRTLLLALLFNLCIVQLPVWCHPSIKGDGQCKVPGEVDEPLICVVVRTYHGHGEGHFPYLEELLHSLRIQTFSRWEALLAVADGNKFNSLSQIVQRLADTRIWIYAELVGELYKARDGGNWRPQYHGLLYNLTDEAIRACPPSTQWVLATNGDNLYARDVFQAVMNTPPTADVVALDYYSRYQRTTGPPCARFAASEGAPACKENRMQWCHTDLGALVFRRSRVLGEDMRFGLIAQDEASPGPEHADGLLAARIVEAGVMGACCAGWEVHRVAGRCLYDHSPSPQRCARMGGVWDDSGSALARSGGECLTEAQAQQRYDGAAGGIAMDFVQLSHDGGLAGFGELGASSTIRCLRMADAATQQNMSVLFFGEKCTEPADMPAVQAFLASDKLQSAQSMFAQAQEAHQLLQSAKEQEPRVEHFMRPPKPPDWPPGTRPAQYRARIGSALGTV